MLIISFKFCHRSHFYFRRRTKLCFLSCQFFLLLKFWVNKTSNSILCVSCVYLLVLTHTCYATSVASWENVLSSLMDTETEACSKYEDAWGALWGLAVPWQGLLLWQVSVSKVSGFLTALTLWSGKAAVPMADSSPCTSRKKARETKEKQAIGPGLVWCDVLI